MNQTVVTVARPLIHRMEEPAPHMIHRMEEPAPDDVNVFQHSIKILIECSVSDKSFNEAENHVRCR